MTISSIPWRIPVREAYLKVAMPSDTSIRRDIYRISCDIKTLGHRLEIRHRHGDVLFIAFSFLYYQFISIKSLSTKKYKDKISTTASDPYRIFSEDQACSIPDSQQKHVWNVCKLRISHVEQGWTCLIENSHLFHVWKNFTPDSGLKFSHQFTHENWVGFPRCRTVSRPITSTLSNTLWTNHIHQNNFDFLMKVALHFED